MDRDTIAERLARCCGELPTRNTQRMADEAINIINEAMVQQERDLSAPGAFLQRDRRQAQVVDWVERAFGAETLTMPDERGARVIEEALELGQSLGVRRDTAERIVGYVFSRPVGEPDQEIGGVGITLLACAATMGLSAEACEIAELERVLAKPLEHFKRRQAEKRAAGLTPGIRSNG